MNKYMKKQALMIAFLVIALSETLIAQSTAFGFKGGVNLSALSGSMNVDVKFKQGILIGTFIDVTCSEIFHFQPELNLSSQGVIYTYRQGSPYSPVVGKTKTKLTYVNIPLLGKFFITDKVNLHVGPQIGLLVSAKEQGTIDGEKVDQNLSALTKGGDFGLTGGIEIDITNQINLGTRIIFGLSDISEQPKDLGYGFTRPSLTNRTIQFTLGYSL